jgi:hypothetical protein
MGSKPLQQFWPRIAKWILDAQQRR